MSRGVGGKVLENIPLLLLLVDGVVNISPITLASPVRGVCIAGTAP